MEVIAEVQKYVAKVTSFRELNQLAAKMTANALNDRHRQRKALKHGGGKVYSLESLEIGSGGESADSTSGDEVVTPDIKDTKCIQPDEACYLGELALLVRFALSKIPPRYGDVVKDFYIVGLKQKQIAKEHGISIGSVGTYLNRGLEAMRNFLPEKSQIF